MKMNLRLLGVSLALLLTTQAFAQENVIRANLLKLVTLGTAELGYDRVISDNFTAGVNLQFIIPRNFTDIAADLSGLELEGNDYTINDVSYNGFKITPEFRYFFSGDAPNGFYGGGFLRFANQSFDSNVDISTNSGSGIADLGLRFISGGAGLDIGYQWILGEHFVIDYHIGAGVSIPGIVFRGSLGDLDVATVTDVLDEINQSFADSAIPVTLTPEDVQQNFSVPLGSGALPIFRSVLSIGYAF